MKMPDDLHRLTHLTHQTRAYGELISTSSNKHRVGLLPAPPSAFAKQTFSSFGKRRRPHFPHVQSLLHNWCLTCPFTSSSKYIKPSPFSPHSCVVHHDPAVQPTHKLCACLECLSKSHLRTTPTMELFGIPCLCRQIASLPIPSLKDTTILTDMSIASSTYQPYDPTFSTHQILIPHFYPRNSNLCLSLLSPLSHSLHIFCISPTIVRQPFMRPNSFDSEIPGHNEIHGRPL